MRIRFLETEIIITSVPSHAVHGRFRGRTVAKREKGRMPPHAIPFDSSITRQSTLLKNGYAENKVPISMSSGHNDVAPITKVDHLSKVCH